MALVEYSPEMLQNIAETLPTGTALFCHKPFKWFEITSYTCAFMRWVSRSDRYHHGALLRWDCGIPFVIEATFFQRSRPKKLSNWVQERKGYIIGVKPQEIDESRLVKELDKPYDKAAAWAMFVERVTGVWIGHTGTHAEAKDLCWELMARTLGFEKPWMVDVKELIQMKNKLMAENTQTPVQQVAADFMAQYTDEEIFEIRQKSPEDLKAYLQAVSESHLEFMIHVLPGRPDRPKKPQV